jgi:triacylglycerol lipase
LTQSPGSLRGLPDSRDAARLTRLLQDLDQQTPGQAFFYLAAVPAVGEHHQAELALAMTALKWPAGSSLLVRSSDKEPVAGLLATLDRLRWLFAGSLGIRVLNLEPAVEPMLAQATRAEVDRADITGLLGPEASPSAAVRHQAARIFRSTRAGMLPRYPVVFCHGMLALSLLKMQLPENRNCFWALRTFFESRGVRAFFPQVSPTSGVAERAAELRDQIRRFTDEPVNIIAHSMGGLDARHMITSLGMAERVRSLTTVSTPHRGTFLADWFVANFRNRVPLLLSLQALGVNVDGFRDCCLAACRDFNARTPNVDSVRYFSYGGSVSPSHLSPALRRAWALLMPVEGPNDGMVSVASAQWSEYLGTLHADHYAQTPDATFVRAGENFDSLGFYGRLVEDLARRGF